REIYRMTDFLLEKIKLYVSSPHTGGSTGGSSDSSVVLGRHITHPGWPFDFSKWTNPSQQETALTVVMQDALDTDEPFEIPEDAGLEEQVEQMSFLLIRFFKMLPDGVLPDALYEKVIRANGNRRLSDQVRSFDWLSTVVEIRRRRSANVCGYSIWRGCRQPTSTILSTILVSSPR